MKFFDKGSIKISFFINSCIHLTYTIWLMRTLNYYLNSNRTSIIYLPLDLILKKWLIFNVTVGCRFGSFWHLVALVRGNPVFHIFNYSMNHCDTFLYFISSTLVFYAFGRRTCFIYISYHYHINKSSQQMIQQFTELTDIPIIVSWLNDSLFLIQHLQWSLFLTTLQEVR